MLKKVRISQIDRAAIVIISAYNVFLFTKAISVLLIRDKEEGSEALKMVDVLNMAGDMTVWFMKYVFVFEMKNVNDIINIVNHGDYLR